MILSKLVELYDRFAEDDEISPRLPRMGTSSQNISFYVVLTPEGKLFDVQDARVTEVIPPKKKGGEPTEKLVPRKMIVPGGAHPTGSAPTPRFLWDQPAYIFGYSEKDDAKAREKLFPAYRDYHREFGVRYAIQDEGYRAVVHFLESWTPDAVTNELREKIASFGPGFGVFRIQGRSGFVYESPEIQSAWERESGTKNLPIGDCLVTGKRNVPVVPVIETKIKLAGTAVGGGAISSFNASAYESYGKSQTLNAPISEEAGFKACNALNVLIQDDRFHVKVAGTTVVFWTGRKTQTESLMGFLFGSSFGESAMDAALEEKLLRLWQIVGRAGDPDLTELGDDVSTPFYMLGIEPNAARIVIRFWHKSTLGDIIVKLRQHHADMAIQRSFEDDPEPIPLWQIVRQTARAADGVPPLLAGAFLRSVIEGLPYPASLYQLVLNRIHVSHRDENGKYRVGGKVTYCQAAIVKGYLKRNKQKGVMGMSLDVTSKEPAYLLGRLFATLEKTQGEAQGDINAGIGDKYYSAASATPRVVFPMLLDLFRKHMKKLSGDKKGLAVVREKLVGEILDGIDAAKGFPANLSLDDRGLFALGYYQQMRTFFTKKDDGVSEQ
ncbi:MAG: type I-C CRISPR-associated protein Cas8c/Csd1 [Kiritimatiellia bacterium]